MKYILIAATMLFAPAAAGAATPDATPAQRVETFLPAVSSPESDKAIDDLFAGSGFAEKKPQDLMTLKGQIKMAMGLYGQQLGVEKIEEQDLSPSVKRLVYIQKFEEFPVAWEFYFYKAHGQWSLLALNFKDQVSSILDSVH